MIKFLRQLFCFHDYEIFDSPFYRYMSRIPRVTLVCKKCGKVKVVYPKFPF